MSNPEPPEGEGNRALENAVMFSFFVALAGAGIWLLSSMAICERHRIVQRRADATAER